MSGARLDPATAAWIQAGCDDVNRQVAEHRRRLLRLAAGCVMASAVGIALAPRAAGAILLGVLLVLGFALIRSKNALARSYKAMVLRGVAGALGRELAFREESTLRAADFDRVQLFRQRAWGWTSEDELSGRHHGVSYSIHEVVAGSNSDWPSSVLSGRPGVDSRSEFFRGLVVRLEFNKHFAGHTVVLPDREGRAPGGLVGSAWAKSALGEKRLVRLENPEFERAFAVYATNDQEARYLLTPKLMELVLEARSLLDAEVRLAFHGNSLFLAVPTKKDRFVVNHDRGVTPQHAAAELLEVVSLAERLIDVLNLGTRIWSRA